MTRRKPFVEVGLTAAERTTLQRAAAIKQTNVTDFVRTAALRAATRQDAVVRGHLKRMLQRDASIIRLLTDCGLVMQSAVEYEAYRSDNPALKDAATRVTERIVDAIAKIGEQS